MTTIRQIAHLDPKAVAGRVLADIHSTTDGVAARANEQHDLLDRTMGRPQTGGRSARLEGGSLIPLRVASLRSCSETVSCQTSGTDISRTNGTLGSTAARRLSGAM